MNFNNIKNKILNKFILVTLLASTTFLFGCTNQAEEAKKLGFADVAEMKKMKENGFLSKSQFNEADAKKLGFENYEEMQEAEKIKGLDPLEYILEKKWSLWNTKCDPLRETYMVFSKDEPFGFYVFMHNKKQMGNQTAEHQYKIISNNSIYRIGRIYLRGNNMLESLVNDPDQTYATEQETKITLITPRKIKIESTNKSIDLEKLLKSRQIGYEEKFSTATSELCEGEDNSSKAKVSMNKTSENFLIGRCTWSSETVNLKSCQPLEVAQYLKLNNEMISYTTWGDSELIIRVLGRGAFIETKVSLEYKKINSNTIDVVVNGRNNCIITDRYTFKSNNIFMEPVSQVGNCTEDQKAAFNYQKSNGIENIKYIELK